MLCKRKSQTPSQSPPLLPDQAAKGEELRAVTFSGWGRSEEMALSGRAGFWQEALDPRFHGDDDGWLFSLGR